MIETRYDPEADVLHASFGALDAIYDGAREVAPGIYIEYDTKGRPMGVEITSAVDFRGQSGRKGQIARGKTGGRVIFLQSSARFPPPATSRSAACRRTSARA